MTVVEAINELTSTLSKPSFTDSLMVAATIIYVLVTTYILLYNINLVKVTKNIQKQNIDLQLFQKRFEVTKIINDYFESQIQNINVSMNSLSGKFVIAKLPQQEIEKYRLSIQQCTILFNKGYIDSLSELEFKINKCFDLLNDVQSQLSEYCFIYHQGGEYDDMIVKMRNYFSEYYKGNIDLMSLENCLNSINTHEVFIVFSELQREYNDLNKIYSENTIHKLFFQKNLSFLENE